MKVVVYPADLGGCGYYRLIWPAKFLKSRGFDVHIIHPQQENKISGGKDDAGNLIHLRAIDADVHVFQRLTSRTVIDAIGILRANGRAVVVDVDDDMRTVDQRNPAWQQLHPGRGILDQSEYNWMNGQRACEQATLVTVSSDALLRRYGMPRRKGDPQKGVIIRNVVPHVLTDIQHDEQSGVFGWGGSLHSHPSDPDVLGNSVTRLTRAGHTFKVVGPGKGVRTAFGLDSEPLVTGSVKIEDWPHQITKLSVGIAPLKDTLFNDAKSWLKPLEYAATGVPCVMSPRAEYRRIAEYGIGTLAEKPKDWFREVQRLLNDDVLRAERSAQGREIVREHLTIERNAWRWWETWKAALEIQTGQLSPHKVKDLLR